MKQVKWQCSVCREVISSSWRRQLNRRHQDWSPHGSFLLSGIWKPGLESVQSCCRLIPSITTCMKWSQYRSKTGNQKICVFSESLLVWFFPEKKPEHISVLLQLLLTQKCIKKVTNSAQCLSYWWSGFIFKVLGKQSCIRNFSNSQC